MPYPRLTFSDLKAQIAADISASVPGADGLLRYTNLGVVGLIQAAAMNGLYGYLDYIALQSNPFTATDEALEAWAGLKGVTRKAATYAMGPVTFSPATNGSDLAAATAVVRADGFPYATTEDVTASGAAAACIVQAATAGAAGNAPGGVVMTLGSAVGGVSADGFATAALTGGADVETDDALRSRMLQAYQDPPQGGSNADYIIWALAVAGVTRVWPVGEGMGPGTVSVYFMMDSAEAAFGGFPQGANGVATAETRSPTTATGDQLAVGNAIYPLQPVTAVVWALAPAANAVAVTIAGLSTASTATKAAIAAAIDAVFLAEGAPGGTVDLSYVEAAIAAISGTAGFVITAVSCADGSVTPGSDGNMVSNAGYLPVRGVITYA